MHKEVIPSFLRFLTAPTRMVRIGATGLRASFAAANVIRDAFATVFASRTNRTPFASLVGLWRQLKDAAIRPDPAVERYRASGAEMATMMGADRATAMRRAGRVVDEAMAYSTWDKIKARVRHPIDSIRAFFEAFENAPRIEEFRKVLAKAEKKWGAGSESAYLEAMLAAKESTINFTRGGVISAVLNQFYPFFNARMQGASKFYRVMAGRDVEGSKSLAITGALARTFAWVTAPSVLLWWMNRDEEWYQKLPAWEKQNNWHFKIGDTILKLPVPQELGKVFGTNVAQALDTWYRSADPTSRTRLNESLVDTFGSFLPMGLDSTNGWLELIPQAVRPPIEAVANMESRSNRPIVSEANLNKLPKDQYDRYTTETAKRLGEWLGVSPAKIEHVLSGYTGGLGLDLLRAGESAAGVRKAPASGWPVASRFVARNPVTEGGSRVVEEFYRRRADLEQRKGSKEIGDADALTLRRMELAADRMSEARRQRNAGTMGETEANRRIDRLAEWANGTSGPDTRREDFDFTLRELERRREAWHKKEGPQLSGKEAGQLIRMRLIDRNITRIEEQLKKRQITPQQAQARITAELAKRW
jgi:hypothetical protein